MTHNWKCVPLYIKNVDTHHESFSSKKQVIKKLSQKSFDKLVWNEQYFKLARHTMHQKSFYNFATVLSSVWRNYFFLTLMFCRWLNYHRVDHHPFDSDQMSCLLKSDLEPRLWAVYHTLPCSGDSSMGPGNICRYTSN